MRKRHLFKALESVRRLRPPQMPCDYCGDEDFTHYIFWDAFCTNIACDACTALIFGPVHPGIAHERPQ